MAKSTLTSKYQTTVPRQIREQLGLCPGNVLCWEIVGGSARVTPGGTAFLDRRDSIHVGTGSAVADVRRARAERGAAVE